LSAVTINGTDKVLLFQRKLTVLPVITAVDSRFELKWSIHKDDAVTSISCDGDCDVTIWVNTRSVNTFKDSFCPCEYNCTLVSIQAGQWLVILLGYLR